MAQEPKVLVVYYSLQGSTQFIANSIAEAVGADVVELQPKKPYPKGFLKFVIGAFQTLFKKSPELQPFDKNPKDYDLIFLGTPVWAGNYTPACRTFLSQAALTGKTIALFLCCGGNAGSTIAKLKQDITDALVIGDIVFKDPVKQDNNAHKAADWAKQIVAEASK